MQRISHWVNNKVVAGTSGNVGKVYNPATGEVQAEVDLASVAEVDAVVAAAKEAFVTWRATNLSRRAEIMFRMRELVDANRKELANIVSLEHGKVPSDAMGEIARGLENIEFACGIPAMVPMWMFANAIMCGNTFVLKPSEKDPSAAMFVADLLRQAGLPEGVFNVLHGDKVSVDRLLEHKDVQSISFVGSTPIAKYVYETGTKNGKRVQALGGAKIHMLVLPDADLDMAADAAVSAAYGSAGERCMAVSVVLAVDSVADALVDKLKSRIPKIKVGPGTDPAAEMGPLISREHRDKVASFVTNANAEGAKVVVDGTDKAKDAGFFLNPSLIDNVKPGMKCYDEEIFGPVLTVMRVKSYQEGLDTINANQFGNGTAIFTRDGGVARQFQFDVQVGMVGINVPIPVPVSYYSFGGWKASLFGDQHMYGPEGINFFTRGKVVTSRWPDPRTSSVNLGFPQNR